MLMCFSHRFHCVDRAVFPFCSASVGLTKNPEPCPQLGSFKLLFVETLWKHNKLLDYFWLNLSFKKMLRKCNISSRNVFSFLVFLLKAETTFGSCCGNMLVKVVFSYQQIKSGTTLCTIQIVRPNSRPTRYSCFPGFSFILFFSSSVLTFILTRLESCHMISSEPKLRSAVSGYLFVKNKING